MCNLVCITRNDVIQYDKGFISYKKDFLRVYRKVAFSAAVDEKNQKVLWRINGFEGYVIDWYDFEGYENISLSQKYVD